MLLSQPSPTSGYSAAATEPPELSASAGGEASASSVTTSATGRPLSISAARRVAHLGASRGGQPGQDGGVRVDDPVRERAEQQQRGLVHGAARREAALGEAGGVDQRQALGTTLDGHPGEPRDVRGDTGGAQHVPHPLVDLVVEHHGVLHQGAPGALPRVAATAVAPDRRVVDEQLRDGAEVVHHPRRPVHRERDVAVDVVERLRAPRVVRPRPGRPVGQPQRAALLQPRDDVDERGPVRAAAGVQPQALDPLRVGGHGVGQLGQRHLDAGPAERGEHQREVGVAAPVEHPPAARAGRALRVEVVDRAHEAGRGGRQLQPVAQRRREVHPQLCGPAAHQRQRRPVRVVLADQRMAQDRAHGTLVVGQLGVRHAGRDPVDARRLGRGVSLEGFGAVIGRPPPARRPRDRPVHRPAGRPAT